MEMIEIHFERTNWYSVWIGHTPTRSSYPYTGECYIKTKSGIKYLVIPLQEFKNPDTVVECIQITRKHQYTSNRPYQLGQACDGSIGAPVTTLVSSYLKSIGQNPEHIFCLAKEDPTYITKKEIQLTEEFAKWQGVTIPDIWTKKHIDGLFQSLTNVNYHELRNYIQENLLISKT